MAKTPIVVNLPIQLSVVQAIPKSCCASLASDCKRGEIALSLGLSNGGRTLSFQVYPDRVKGHLSFTFRADVLTIEADCIFAKEVDELKLGVFLF